MISFSASQVAVVCPTKNNELALRAMLDSLSAQTGKCGQVIICDASDVMSDLSDYTQTLRNFLHIKAPLSGQVLQRNHAFSFLEETIKLVITLDDDVILSKNAVFSLVDFWNSHKCEDTKPLGGVALNVINSAKPRLERCRHLLFMPMSRGKISKSGYSSGLGPLDGSEEPEWLLGGSSAWSAEVLSKIKHPIDFSTKWAFCEDLLFSYKASKQYSFSVCREAKLLHRENYNKMNLSKAIFYGKTMVIMRYFFVSSNEEFSKVRFFWMASALNLGYLSFGLSSKRYLGFGFGGIMGLILCLKCAIFSGSPKELAASLFGRQ